MKEQRPGAANERTRRRRRFGILAAAMGALFLLAGTQFANRDGVLEVVGMVSLAYGVGLVVAGLALALGHNPLDRCRR